MAKVLISFVGTGAFNERREYRTATYEMEGKQNTTSFMAAALTDMCQVDKVILIGTPHSMWEEVYRYFSEKNNRECKDDIYYEIGDFCEKATAETVPEIPRKKEIEEAVGNAHIALIKYGITESEIEENIETILKLQDQFSNGDEIIVDITHSFRSLPLLIMNLLIYLKNVSRKGISISHVYYGMLEVAREKGFAPIVDLKNVLNITDWIVGAYSFSEYGNAYKIAELLKGTDNELASRLKHFSDDMNLNHLDALEDESVKLRSLKKKEYSPMAEMIVKPVIDDFMKSLGNTNGNPALFQYRLARWQFDHMNYASSFMSAQESIITYECMQMEKDWRNIEVRNDAKTELYGNYKWFKDMIRSRNCLTHSIKTIKNAQSMIEILRKALDEIGKSVDPKTK